MRVVAYVGRDKSEKREISRCPHLQREDVRVVLYNGTWHLSHMCINCGGHQFYSEKIKKRVPQYGMKNVKQKKCLAKMFEKQLPLLFNGPRLK